MYSYTTNGAVNDGEYLVIDSPTEAGVNKVDYLADVGPQTVSNGTTSISTHPFASVSTVKFVFINWEDSEHHEKGVKSVTVKEGRQEVKDATDMQLVLNKDGYITYVVVADEATDATGSNVAYVSALTGNTKVGNKAAYVYTLYIDGAKVTDVVSTKENMAGKFVTYAAGEDNVYTLSEYKETSRTTSVGQKVVSDASEIVDDRLLTVSGSLTLNVEDALVIDLSDNKIGSVSDITDLLKLESTTNVKLAYIYNGNSSSVDCNNVSYLFVVDTNVE